MSIHTGVVTDISRLTEVMMNSSTHCHSVNVVLSTYGSGILISLGCLDSVTTIVKTCIGSIKPAYRQCFLCELILQMFPLASVKAEWSVSDGRMVEVIRAAVGGASCRKLTLIHNLLGKMKMDLTHTSHLRFMAGSAHHAHFPTLPPSAPEHCGLSTLKTGLQDIFKHLLTWCCSSVSSWVNLWNPSSFYQITRTCLATILIKSCFWMVSNLVVGGAWRCFSSCLAFWDCLSLSVCFSLSVWSHMMVFRGIIYR